MEEIVSLPPIEFFNDDYQMVLDFIESLGNPKYKIAGNVNIFNSNITNLGNLVEVGGNLDIRYAPITSLPDNLYIGGFLTIQNVSLLNIPEKLNIEKHFFIANTPLSTKYDQYEIDAIIVDKGGHCGLGVLIF